MSFEIAMPPGNARAVQNVFNQRNRFSFAPRLFSNQARQGHDNLFCLHLHVKRRLRSQRPIASPSSSFNSSNLNCVIPCDLRSNTPNIVMGNHIAHLSLDLPMNIEGNIPLLWSFNDSTKRVKQNGDYATMYLYTSMVYLLFPMCIGRRQRPMPFDDLTSSSLANKIMARIYDNSAVWLTTIAAGSSTALSTMSICNRDVRSFVCLNPSMGTSCINFCVTCYADEVRLSVVADPQLVPHPEFFTECFNQQVNERLGTAIDAHVDVSPSFAAERSSGTARSSSHSW